MHNLTEDQLLDQAVRGDRDALGSLLFLHYDAIGAFIRRQMPTQFQSVLSVDDVLQESFVLAFRKIESFENRGQEAFRGWMESLASNRLQDLIRGLQCQKRGRGFRRMLHKPKGQSFQSSVHALVDRLVVPQDRTPSQNLASDEAVKAVHIGLAELPVDQRTAMQLRYIEQKTVDEVAGEMDKSPGAIRGLVHRAKGSLKVALGRSTRWFGRE